MEAIAAAGIKIPDQQDWYQKITPAVAEADSRLQPFIGMYHVTCTTDLLQEGEIVHWLSIYRQIVQWEE